MQDVDYYRQTLESLKERHTHRMHKIDKDIRHEGMSADWSEQATERENDEVLESLGQASQNELSQINTALKRIDAGDYFHCSQCGAEISEARLKLLPYTTICASCAQKHEAAD